MSDNELEKLDVGPEGGVGRRERIAQVLRDRPRAAAAAIQHSGAPTLMMVIMIMMPLP